MLFDRCPWYVAGPLIGLVLIAFRAALNKPFGALGGFIEIVEKKPFWSHIGVSGFVLIGTILGAALYAIITGTFQPSFNYGVANGVLPEQPIAAFAILLGAGAVMGFGARWAGGCTSGHGLTGMSLVSPASIAATMTFFATAVLLAHAFAWLTGVTS